MQGFITLYNFNDEIEDVRRYENKEHLQYIIMNFTNWMRFYSDEPFVMTIMPDDEDSTPGTMIVNGNKLKRYNYKSREERKRILSTIKKIKLLEITPKPKIENENQSILNEGI